MAIQFKEIKNISPAMSDYPSIMRMAIMRIICSWQTFRSKIRSSLCLWYRDDWCRILKWCLYSTGSVGRSCYNVKRHHLKPAIEIVLSENRGRFSAVTTKSYCSETWSLSAERKKLRSCQKRRLVIWDLWIQTWYTGEIRQYACLWHRNGRSSVGRRILESCWLWDHA